MFSASHKDFACLINIREAIEKIESYVQGYSNADEFNSDSKSFDAAMMNFVVIGEMAEKLSDEFKKETEEDVNWFSISGFRNIIAHNYFGIDAEEVWQIINNNLVDLKDKISSYID